MTTLIVSGARKRPPKGGILMSILLHSVIIVAAILGTAHVVRPTIERVEEHVVLYQAPKQPDPPPLQKQIEPHKVHVAPKAPPEPPKAHPTPRFVQPQPKAPVLVAPAKINVTLPPADLKAAPVTEVAVAVRDPGPPSPPASSDKDGSSSDKGGKAGGTGSGKENSGEAFSDDQVEKVAQRISGPQPRYPEGLRAGGVTGEVIARFIVGTNGRVESGSIEIVSSPNKQFSDAVRTALSGTRFRPAEVGGRAVRQLVEQPFTFKLE